MFKILSILFVLCFVPQVVQATTINSVTVLEVDGANASVFRAGGQRANPTVNMNLSNNSAVETGLQTTVTLNIGENSTLKLAAESRVTINTTGNALTFTVNNGNAWLIVSENEQNLQLNVGGINLTAHESIFAIGHGSDYVYVAMLLGESEIAETMIEEGQIFILRNNQTGLSDINLADLNQFTLNEISNNSENLLENSTFVTQTVLSQVRNLITAEPPQQSATFARRSWREAQDRWRAAQITRRADDSRIRQERNANLPDVVFVPNNPPVVTTPPILPTPFPPVVIPTPQPTQPPVVIPTPQPTQPPVATPTPTEPPTATPTPTQPPTATPTPTEPPTATPQPTPTPIPEQLLIEQGILEEINRIRAEHGLGSLTMAEPLVLAARDHALDSVTNNILGHTGSDGSNVRERVLRHGWPGWEVQLSETLAAGSDVPAITVQDWMDSEGHRGILLDPVYTLVGVGFVNSPGPGQFFSLGTVAVFSSTPPARSLDIMPINLPVLPVPEELPTVEEDSEVDEIEVDEVDETSEIKEPTTEIEVDDKTEEVVEEEKVNETEEIEVDEVEEIPEIAEPTEEPAKIEEMPKLEEVEISPEPNLEIE